MAPLLSSHHHFSAPSRALFLFFLLSTQSSVVSEPQNPNIQAIWYHSAEESFPNTIHWSCGVAQEDTRRRCCEAIETILEEECQSYWRTEQGNVLCELDRQFAISTCEFLLAPVPLKASPAGEEWSLVLSLPPREPVYHHQPKSFNTDDLELLYLRDGQWTSEGGTLFERIDGDLPESTADTSASTATLYAELDSTLSRDGGMHRQLHHIIRLKPDEAIRNHHKLSGSLTILIFLTQDVFIDIDDPFGGSCTSSPTNADDAVQCQASLLHQHGRIDIEQPAFASPQHVVAVEIKWNTTTTLKEMELHMTMQLHLRYAKPIRNGRYHAFLLPTPILQRGKCESVNSTNKCTVNLTSKNAAIQQVVHVAAGLESDNIWVTVMTLLCSLIGAAVLLREIVTVSQWE
jgi:hypothetical protein